MMREVPFIGNMKSKNKQEIKAKREIIDISSMDKGLNCVIMKKFKRSEKVYALNSKDVLLFS